MGSVEPADGEMAVLRRLLGLAMAPQQEAAWQELERPAARFAIAATFFLLCVPARDESGLPDVEFFAVNVLERLLQHLSRRTEELQTEYQGRVRGRIVWPATYKARYGQDYDPSRYVCREVRHQFDTPENQTVKYAAEHVIGGCLSAVPDLLRAGTCYQAFPREGREAHSRIGIAIRLANIETALNRFRHNAYMREVTLPRQLTDTHTVRAGMAKLDEYRAAVQICRYYEEIVRAPSRATLVSIGQRVLPLPARTGDDAEPWLRLAAAILRS
jgi:hypothetical protein